MRPFSSFWDTTAAACCTVPSHCNAQASSLDGPLNQSTITVTSFVFSSYPGGQRSTVGMLPPSDSEEEEEEEGEKKEGEEKPKAKAASSSKGGQSKKSGTCVYPPIQVLKQVLKQVLQGALVSPAAHTWQVLYPAAVVLETIKAHKAHRVLLNLLYV